MALPVITYKVTNSTLRTDEGLDITETIFRNVNTAYTGRVQLGEVQASYLCENVSNPDGFYKITHGGKRIVNIDYTIPADMIREFNPEQFMLVEKQMIADTFGIDPNNIEIRLDGVGVPDSTFA